MSKVMTSALLVLLLGFASGQQPPDSDANRQIITERGVETEVAPGITVLIMDSGQEKAKFTLAQEVYVSPRYLSIGIPFDKEITGVLIEVSSKVLTEVTIVSDSPDKMLLRSGGGSPLIVLPAGARVSVNFTAYEPHDGIISIYNTEGELLDQVPYSVAQESRVRQTVSANVSSTMATDFTDIGFSTPIEVSAGYQIRDRVTGVQGAFTVNYNGELKFKGSIGGSYSW